MYHNKNSQKYMQESQSCKVIVSKGQAGPKMKDNDIIMVTSKNETF